MKKIFILFCFLIIAPITCSERSWLRNKVDTFAKQIATRHTYEYNSWEHKRDRAILCLLPAKTSQMVLTNQRFNMIKFLKQNEEDALQGIKDYLNYDDEKWSKVMMTIKQESEFNINAMRQQEHCDTTHDPSLPDIWTAALKKECARHGLKYENINFGTIDYRGAMAEAISYRAIDNGSTYKYQPAEVNLRLSIWDTLPQKELALIIAQTAAHEMVHIIKQDGLIDFIISEEIIRSTAPQELLKKRDDLETKKQLIDSSDTVNRKQIDEDLATIKTLLDKYYHTSFKSEPTGERWSAAVEKTADTLIACSDPEIAKGSISYMNDGIGYYANYNDMKVIHENWQTSQAITRFQQLKNSIRQKLSVFPKPFA